MNLLISTISLSHSRCIEYEPFVSSSKTNFNYKLLHKLFAKCFSTYLSMSPFEICLFEFLTSV